MNVVESECEALRHLKEGRSVQETAEIMGVNAQTIHTYCYRARQKLGVNINEETIAILFDE